MKNIFWGFFLMFFDFNLNFDTMTINLLPDFLGAYLIIAGLRSLTDVHTDKAIYLTRITMLMLMINFVMDLFGLDHSLGNIYSLLTFLFSILELISTYYVIDVFKQLEVQKNIDLYSSTLIKLLYISAGLTICMLMLTELILIIPYIAVLAFLPGFLILIVYIIFLVYVHKAYKNDEAASE